MRSSGGNPGRVVRWIGRPGVCSALLAVSGSAWAQERVDSAAARSWGGNEQGFAEPPPGRSVPYADPPDDRPVVAQPYDDRPSYSSSWSNWDRERSPVRLTVGPQSSFTNHGAHFGALAGLDFGPGRLGGRLSASWARGLESSAPSASLSQFGGELTLDLAKRGILHPVFGLGLAVLYVTQADVKAFAGAGTLRAGLEVPLPVREADLRVGVSAQGGLVGPSDERLERMRALANVLGTFSLGF